MKGGRPRHKPLAASREARLKALELQEKHQRDLLASRYGLQRAPDSYKAPMPLPLRDNPYYIFFRSPEDDAEVTKKLLDDPHQAESLTKLKPDSAKLYVKFEKIFEKMRAEDDEFVTFRKKFLEEGRRIAVTGGFTVAPKGGSTADLHR